MKQRSARLPITLVQILLEFSLTWAVTLIFRLSGTKQMPISGVVMYAIYVFHLGTK
ncbi:hypothetical protein V1522DRAFT_416412 [Lipomyces starkeyi]